MAKLSVWFGAGVVTAGVSTALLAGAGTANADVDGGPDAGSAESSAASGVESGSGASTVDRVQRGPGRGDAQGSTSNRRAESTAARTSRADDESDAELSRASLRAIGVTRGSTGPEPARNQATAAQSTAAGRSDGVQRAADVDPPPPRTPDLAAQAPGDGPLPTENTGEAGIIGDLIGPFQPDYPPIVKAVGSTVFNLLGALVQTFDGPPVVPPELRDSIQVGTSTLSVAPGTDLQADWYFPTHGQPQRLIYLQHGILATGPMYSYTAALLAERTNSVVVATTITSNPFSDNNMWLGGDAMHKAVAQLLLDDDRQALNASLATAAAEAGRSDLTVPADFVIVGHSLGGGFAPGVAGYYAEGLVARRADGQDADNHLAGLVLLDAVPFAPILPNAMERLNRLEASNNWDPDDYVPVYEIGAPPNFLNSSSTVNRDLSEARPGKFNGVVINGGVHMDGMLGGNPLIQLAAYLVAGAPQPQNPPAVQLLMAGWINDMFEGTIDPTTGRCLGDGCAGSYGEPGETIVIPSDGAVATAVVIDSGALPPSTLPWTARFEPRDVTSVAGQKQSRSIALRIAV
ncbi:alpha/beta hydrolase [Mycolicibacterium sp. S2-37]|uniref:alpha/beta hydrolase n=1 Tax=Mycolicibacterium sp. S2-37 TaxID=2810297 RepID=UPI001A94BA95|nr:alpha/beta hydrolase [Mycolicibacterium sp. S2-37]MBO0681347.1 alpha/beta hydrolase [Mycolicibacterium sp. S2-37]